jgi:hypothetical protein
MSDTDVKRPSHVPEDAAFIDSTFIWAPANQHPQPNVQFTRGNTPLAPGAYGCIIGGELILYGDEEEDTPTITLRALQHALALYNTLTGI